jgi:hypothetical protein
MNDDFFQKLEPKEEELFRQWARDTFTPNMEVNPLWHPVVREEIAKLQATVKVE